jgi:hypothetical protein
MKLPRGAGRGAVAVVAGLTLVAAAPGDAKRKPRRPGCGTFCQQAGPPAGTPGPAPVLPVKFFGRELRVHGGAVKIDVKCILEKRCVGAVGVWSYRLADRRHPFGRLGAVDMSIPAGKRTRVTVPLSSWSLELIRKRPTRSVPATIRGFEKGRCFGPNDCATSGEADRSVRITLS